MFFFSSESQKKEQKVITFHLTEVTSLQDFARIENALKESVSPGY